MDPQDQQQNPPPSGDQSEVLQFVDGMIDEKFGGQGEEISPEARDELRKDLLIRLDDFIMARVISALSDEDLATFENLIKEGKSREELQQFATEHVEDFTNFATDAFIEFRT